MQRRDGGAESRAADSLGASTSGVSEAYGAYDQYKSQGPGGEPRPWRAFRCEAEVKKRQSSVVAVAVHIGFKHHSAAGRRIT